MSVGRLLEARVYRSLRLRGQLLVLVAALLGAVMGVAFGLTGERGDTAAVAAPGRASRVAPATTPASSRPPASRAAGSGGQADSSDPAGHQRAESVDRPGKGHDKPHRHERDRDKPGRSREGQARQGQGQGQVTGGRQRRHAPRRSLAG
jgi:hypothetical protein